MNILIAEDELSLRSSLKAFLGTDHEVVVCENGSQAMEELTRISHGE